MITAHSDAFTLSPNFVDLPQYWWCRRLPIYRRSTHVSAATSHEVGLLFHINSEASCRTSVPSNNVLNLFQRSDATSTSMSTQSQRNDGITSRMFHQTAARLWSQHYQYLWYSQWVFQHTFGTCDRFDLTMFHCMLISLTYYLEKLSIFPTIV